MSEPQLILVFLQGGQVALEEDGEQVWASDDDDDFTEAFGNQFHDSDDADDIIAYLVEEGLLSEEEADEIDIDVESLDGNESDVEIEGEEAEEDEKA